jgi:hypothetical protein
MILSLGTSRRVGRYWIRFGVGAVFAAIAALFLVRDARAGDHIELQHVEVTQGIQDSHNSVALIAGKRTFVRVFVEYTAPTPIQKVRGTIELRRQSGSVQTVDSFGGIPTTLDPAQNGNLDAKREVMDRSLLFELPIEWTSSGDVSVSLASVKLENGATLNCTKCDERVSFKFGQAAPMRVVLLGMRYTRGGKTLVPRDIDYRSIVSWVQRAYPASDFEFQTRVVDWAAPPVFDTGTESCGEANAAITAFRKLDIANGKNALFHYYGVVYDGAVPANFMRGCSSIPPNPDPSAIGSGPAGRDVFPWDKSPSYAGWYAGHELGHTFGRHHPNSGCGDWDPTGDPQWPPHMPKDKLGTATQPFVVFDPGDASLPVPMSVLGWDAAADLMTYCNFVWPSAHNYIEICNRLAAENKSQCPLSASPGGAGATPVGALSISGPGGSIALIGRPNIPLLQAADTQAAPPDSTSPPADGNKSSSDSHGPVLSVTGRINLDRQTGTISSVSRFEQSIENARPSAGDPDTPLIRSFDAQGTLLSQMPATVLLDTDRAADSLRTGVVTGEVPYANDIARLELVYRDKALAVRSSAPARPAITQPVLEPSNLKDLLKNDFSTFRKAQLNPGPQAAAPNEPSDANKGALVYTWQNQGGADVKYTVQISTNGGKEWNTVAVETPQHTITIDPSWIAGASTLDVRVRASDGIHETVSTSKQLDFGTKIPLQ